VSYVIKVRTPKGKTKYVTNVLWPYDLKSDKKKALAFENKSSAQLMANRIFNNLQVGYSTEVSEYRSSSAYRSNPSHIRALPKNVTDKTYTERVKLRGYNGPVTVFSAHGADAGKILRKLHPEATKAEHLSLAAKYQKRAYQMDALYGRLLNRAARQTWGRDWRTSDYRVSGIGSNEFSASMKKRLRDANTLLNAYARAYRAHQYAAGKRTVT